MAKDAEYNRLIHTARWLRLRRRVLTARPLCERCEQEGRLTAGREVHHVRPVEHGLTAAEKERLMFDPQNLRALCRPCHVSEHESMGRSGRAAARRINDAHTSEAISRFFGDE